MNIFRNKIAVFWVLCLAISVLFFSGIENNIFAAEEGQQQEEEIDEEAVEETEEKIEKYEKKLDKETEQRDTLQQNVNQIQYSINVTQNEINKTESLIENTEETISRKENEIEMLGKKLEFQKEALKSLARELYYSKKESEVNIVFNENSYIKVFGNLDGLHLLEEKTLSLMDSIRDSRIKIDKDKKELEGDREEHEELLAQKEAQQKNLVYDRNIVQYQVNQKEATISELQQKMSELRTDLNRILGKSYDTGEIKDAIKFANKQTGVRKGFLFGMLKMESGGNPLAGGCVYSNCGMSDKRKKYFKDICDELDISDKKCKNLPVSCASPKYPGSGGAMGAAQFMSDTWMGYNKKISAATGHDPPDPWSLIDGVVAMALYLEDLGANKSGKVSIKEPCEGRSVSVDWEIYASMRYLGWTCWGYTNYAPAVQSLAKGYDKL